MCGKASNLKNQNSQSNKRAHTNISYLKFYKYDTNPSFMFTKKYLKNNWTMLHNIVNDDSAEY